MNPIVTQAEAKASGAKRYFTGKPCKHGHVAERFVRCGTCSICARSFSKAWEVANVKTRSDQHSARYAAKKDEILSKERANYAESREERCAANRARYAESHRERQAAAAELRAQRELIKLEKARLKQEKAAARGQELCARLRAKAEERERNAALKSEEREQKAALRSEPKTHSPKRVVKPKENPVRVRDSVEHKLYHALWRMANGDSTRAYSKAYRKANPELMRAHHSNKRARKFNATPTWADMAGIKAKYAECARTTKATGIPHEVDHIVPLRNKRVCGLHVPWNLRVITAEENKKKLNTFMPELLYT